MIQYIPGNISSDIPGIIVLSHGPFAKALVDTASLILGELDNVAVLAIENEDDLDEYQEQLQTMHRIFPKGSIFLVDLYGGTPYNQLVIFAHTKQVDVHALTGMSLNMLIEALSLRYECSGAELIESLEGIVNVGIVNVGKMILLNLKTERIICT